MKTLQSQGQTIRQPNSVFADLNTSFQQAMSYVILSRVTSLNQLYLTKFDTKKICCNKLAKREAGNLRARAINFITTETELPGQYLFIERSFTPTAPKGFEG